MGASESTAITNGTNQEGEERKQSSSVVVKAAKLAAVGIATYAVVSRMLSDNTEAQENRIRMEMEVEPDSYMPEASSQPHTRTWSPPPLGRKKMNTDGGCRPNQGNDDNSVKRGPSGYGGILRDDSGEWVRGFIGYIDDVSDSLTAEFHGILKGLELLDKLRFRGAFLETDCEAAYKWLTKPYKNQGKTEIIHNCWNIINKCRQLVDKNDITINHISGQYANKCADKLANMGIEKQEEYVEIRYLPNEISDLVYKEAKLSARNSCF